MIPDRHKKKAQAAALAVALAAPAEGIRQYAYYDPPGILTVCRGHTGADVVKGKKYSLAECDQFMNDDMRQAVAIADKCMPDAPVEVLGAFSDAVYNKGATIACNVHESHAARYLVAKEWLAACNELPKWDKARVMGVIVALPGLTKRQRAEQELCLQGAG